jgi:hypothetical protein
MPSVRDSSVTNFLLVLSFIKEILLNSFKKSSSSSFVRDKMRLESVCLKYNAPQNLSHAGSASLCFQF